MRYAWPKGTDISAPDLELSKRIKAEDHKNERGICPLHGCQVMSQKVDGIWQWIHLPSLVTDN